MMSKLICLWLLLFFASCFRVKDQLEPEVSLILQERHLENIRGQFPPLSEEESRMDWAKEYQIAKAFIEDLDLYRAISSFKRAKILSKNLPIREHEIEYNILLCYFLANRYEDLVESFEKSNLSRVDKTFGAHRDLLLVLFEAYHKLKEKEKKAKITQLIEEHYPQTSEELKVSLALREADLVQIEEIAKDLPSPSYLNHLQDRYRSEKKSVTGAQALNALIPGGGYLYLGQKKSAVTAFLLNGLFIAAATQFFLHKHYAAGIITTGFEAGWYFGGIYGAGEEAKYYNERLYEKTASTVLSEHKLFPTLMLNHAF